MSEPEPPRPEFTPDQLPDDPAFLTGPDLLEWRRQKRLREIEEDNISLSE